MKTLLLAFLSLYSTCCVMDKDYPLFVQNNTSGAIQASINEGGEFGPLYPDTLLPNSKVRLSLPIPSDQKLAVAGGTATWASVFATKFPSDTLSLFIYDSDTLATYDWPAVRSGYKILGRFDLSLSDLERLGYVVKYPPDASMTGIKSFIRY